MHAALFGSDSEDDEDDAPRPPPPTPAPAMPSTSTSTGGSAHNMLSTLLSEHSTQQTTIAQQQTNLAASQARETAANQAVVQAANEVTRLQKEMTDKYKTIGFHHARRVSLPGHTDGDEDAP